MLVYVADNLVECCFVKLTQKGISIIETLSTSHTGNVVMQLNDFTLGSYNVAWLESFLSSHIEIVLVKTVKALLQKMPFAIQIIKVRERELIYFLLQDTMQML